MNRPHLRIWTSLLPFMFLGISPDSNGQALFESHDILEVQIEGPLTTFSRERSDVDYLDGTFSFKNELGESKSFDLKLRARGRYRRQKKTCNFPPVRLNFKTDQVEGTAFSGEDKLKLVTHCQNDRYKNEQFVLREYMAYRIFQILTDKSFRTRLLRITYIDNEAAQTPMTKFGFVIEDDDNVGTRIGLASLATKSLTYRELDARHTNLINLFQYLIGNTDYSLIRGPNDDDCCHNSVPFSDGNLVSAVPYDFDFAGLVDAPYAQPNPQLKLRDVRTRLYRGRCDNNEHISGSVTHIFSKKDEILGLMDQIVGFDQASLQSMTRFLNEFFTRLSEQKNIERYLIRKCS